MKKSLALQAAILFLMLACGSGQAADRGSLTATLNEGNAHYQSGDFPAAERAYQSLLVQGVDSGVLYYNLGNACFKQKKLGEAIYFWEQARRRLQRDPDVRENLQFANLMLVDRIDIPEDPLPIRFLSGTTHLLTMAQESRIVLLLFVGGNILFSIYLLTRRPRLASWALTGSLIAIFLTLLVSASLAWKVYENNHRRQGVVVEQKIDVRSGPGIDNVTVVTIHEGVIVDVRSESNGWFQVSLPNGWTGWLPGNSVRIL